MSIGRTLNYHDIPPHLYWKSRWSGRAQDGNGKGPAALFTRADHGWAQGMDPTDRFVKNTYEILSPLNELTAQMQMTGHQFLTPDFKVQRSIFGEGENQVVATVNMGAADYSVDSRLGGTCVLPPGGFLIEAPTFIAFHARNWNGLTYRDAPLFTLRSMDGLPLSSAHRVRVFHGFGDSRVKLGGRTCPVPKEETLGATTSAATDSAARGGRGIRGRSS